METRTYQVYKYDELPDDAKQKAIEKHYDINTEHDWWDCEYEDFKEIGKCLGIDIKDIWFSGFASQGDGLCFTGAFEYRKGWRKALDAYAPKRWKDHRKIGEWVENKRNAELHAIGERLQDLQRPVFYGVSGDISHSGHYQHSGCTLFNIRHTWDYEVEVNFDYEDFKQVYRELMDTFYYVLEHQHDYLTSDEQIAETLRADDYDFTINGNIA